MAPPNSTTHANVSTPVPFPQPDAIRETNEASSPTPATSKTRDRSSTNASNVSNRIRTASLKLIEANPPPGMWAATGQTVSKAPSLADIRRGSFGSDGWDEQTQRNRASSRTSQGDDAPRSPTSATAPTEEARRPYNPKRKGSGNKTLSTEPFPTLTEEQTATHHEQDQDVAPAIEPKQSSETADQLSSERPQQAKRTPSGGYTNGYVPPPKLPWKRSFAIGAKGFWAWFTTPAGFLITIYGLNVVAWGGMLFLLLCNAAPAMCTPTCNDINSPRRKWIEYDSQILNALFCVTGFGLAPWRFRDLYWLGCWRFGGSNRKDTGIRRLAGIHRGWYRLPGSDQLPDEADANQVDPQDLAVPIPVKSIPDPPPTGIRAPPTKGWKMDFVVWNNVWNTLFQIVLCFYMWHYNRIERPSWATGLFVALGCGVAGIAGIMMWHEGKNVKKVEGVPQGRKDYNDKTADTESSASQNVPLVSTAKAARS
ncbi:hypothetical protein ACN47E_003274 [Coniothyrium glycines]